MNILQWGAQIQSQAADSIQEGAEFMATTMIDLVDVQCTGAHSIPPAAPQRESGYGQSGIQVENTKDGANVGVPPMTNIPGRKKQPNLSGMPGRNYMAGHDTGIGVSGGQQRRWLSDWRNYEPTMTDLIIANFSRRSGAA